MQAGKPHATALVQKAGYQVNTSPCSEGLEPLEWGGLWGALYKPEVSMFIRLCPPVATVIFCVFVKWAQGHLCPTAPGVCLNSVAVNPVSGRLGYCI